MEPQLFRILVALAVVVMTSSLVLVAYSWVRSQRAAYENFRRAAYLATLGDVATRAGYPSQLVRGWAKDRVFRFALVEFLTFLSGTERENLISAAYELEIVDHYRRELSEGRRRRTRVGAAEALGDLADPVAVNDLLVGLSDRVPEVRVQCAHALAAISDPLTVSPLLDRLIEERERWVAERLADALRRFDAAAVLDASLRIESLSFDRDAPSWAVLVTRVLGAIGDTRAEPALLHAISSEARLLRQAAAAGLGRAGTPAAVPALLTAATDRHPAVRLAAVESLGMHLDTAALKTMEDLLHDPTSEVRAAAGEALTKIPGGEETLLEAIRLGQPSARSAAADAVLEAGIYRQATVRIRAKAGSSSDHLLVDTLHAIGRIPSTSNDVGQRTVS